jgi:hypothetical protein
MREPWHLHMAVDFPINLPFILLVSVSPAHYKLEGTLSLFLHNIRNAGSSELWQLIRLSHYIRLFHSAQMSTQHKLFLDSSH